MVLAGNDLKSGLFKLTLDSLPDGILLIDAERNLIYHNERFREMWRIPSELLEAAKSKDLVSFASSQVEQSSAFISKVESLYVSNESYEDELLFKDGRIFKRRSESFSDEHFGRARIWIFTDITDQKKAEEAIQHHSDHLELLVQERTAELLRKQQELIDSNEKYRSLSDASSEGIAITEQGVILESNMALDSMLGYEPGELTGLAVTHLVPPDQQNLVKGKMESGSEKAYRTRSVRKDGTEFPVEVHGKMFEYRGQMARVAAIRDLTQQQKAEEEIQMLSGLLPICSRCKKIRDDQGYWNKIESYIEKHSDARFSHGMCDECMERMYGREAWFKKK